MWTVIYVAPNRSVAEMLKGLLEDEGLLVMLRPLGIPHFGDARQFEVVVPDAEAEDASAVLNGAFGG